MSKSEVVNLLKVIVQALKELDESQYKQLLEGKGRIKFIELEPRLIDKGHKRRRSRRIDLSDEEIHTLAVQLRQCKTRDDAKALLHKDGSEILRRSLLQLARLLEVHINNNDKNSIVEEKIVEFVVGVRLRSEAIMGLNLKSSAHKD